VRFIKHKPAVFSVTMRKNISEEAVNQVLGGNVHLLNVLEETFLSSISGNCRLLVVHVARVYLGLYPALVVGDARIDARFPRADTAPDAPADHAHLLPSVAGLAH